MELRILQDRSAADFLAATESLLIQDEASNSLMLGLCESIKSMAPGPDEPLLVRFMDGDQPVAAAIQVQRMNLILTACPNEHLESLADFLMEQKIQLPGVVGPAKESEVFAEIWARKTGLSFSLGMGQKIYELRKVVPPPAIEGRLRRAMEKELPLIEKWIFEFCRESLPEDTRSPEFWHSFAVAGIQDQSIHVWEVDGRAVAMAKVSRPTRNGISVNGVYTPPDDRREGYASSLVAKLSQKMLDSGKSFCVLYTDLANPTSNKIYQQVGYREVSDSKHFLFK